MDSTYPISHQQWTTLCGLVSRQALGRPVRVQIEDPEIGDQEFGRYLSFGGLSISRRAAHVHATEFGIPGGGMIDHRVEGPRQMYVRERDGEIIDCIAIQADSGAYTLLWFEHPLALEPGNAESGQL
jgi:Family of unknown function (DUF5335)